MHIEGMTGTMPACAELFDRGPIDAGHRAHVAQVDRLAVVVGQRDPLAEQDVGGAEVQRPGPAAELVDAVGEILVDFAGQHPLDDGQRGVVGVAAALDEAAAAGRPRPWPG